MRFSKTKLAAFGLSAVLMSSFSNTAQAGCSSTIYTGTVCFMASNFCPRGFYAANGAMIATSQDPALFSLSSNNFGGNGTTDFALPDMRGRAAVGYGNTPYYAHPVTIGLKRGVQTVSMALSQMATHHHLYEVSDIFISGTLKASTTTGGLGSPEDNYLSVSTETRSEQYAPSGTTVQMAPSTVIGTVHTSGIKQTETAGAGQAFANEGPRLALTACVAKGTNLYPPRD